MEETKELIYFQLCSFTRKHVVFFATPFSASQFTLEAYFRCLYWMFVLVHVINPWFLQTTCDSPVYLKQQNCAHINNKAGTSLLTLDPLGKNKKILIPNRKSEKLAVYFGVNDEISIRFLYWKDFRTQFCVIFRYLSDVATYDSTCFWNPLNWLHYRRNFFLEIPST